MAINIREEKNILRAEYKRRRADISAERKKALDDAICAELISLACFSFADTVLLYSPIGSEIDLAPVAEAALARGKRVAYPVCNTADSTLTFRYVADPSELTAGSYSIGEPSSSAEAFGGEENSVCIVPALSFDRGGFRLGYGKGFYDRFLADFNGDRRCLRRAFKRQPTPRILRSRGWRDSYRKGEHNNRCGKRKDRQTLIIAHPAPKKE